ncbi:MAG: hypothetical protein PVJ27_03935 [Candidatus Brocadiaceae bacterium]
MSAKQAPAERSCPGEEYAISLAICRTRQRNQYPKCLLCPHREAEVAGSVPTDPKVPSSIFRRTAVLGGVPQDINDYVIRKVGLAAAQFLRSENPSRSRLAVACDARENSRSFTRAFSEGVNRGGMDVVNLGTAPPEMLAFLLGTDGFAGGAFVGGGNYSDKVNGVRIWRADGRLVGFGSGLDKVGLIARRMRLGCSRLPGEMTGRDPLSDYVSYLLKFAPDIRPLKLLIDAGNGTAGRVVRKLFADLPAEIVPLRFEEDGHSPLLGKRFPSDALVASVRDRARRVGADLGAAFDFAAERIVFFDERGDLLRHDVAAGLLATEMLGRNPGGRVTFDVRSTAMLRARIAEAGGEPVSAPTTRLEFAQHFRRNDALYGADNSGLHYFRDFFRFPSPVLALLIMCSHQSGDGRSLSELAGELDRLARSGEVSIALPSAEMAQPVLTHVRDEFQHADRELIDGLTVRTGDWWFNLRQPRKAAELRLSVEGKSSRDVRRGRQTVERLVQRALSKRSS